MHPIQYDEFGFILEEFVSQEEPTQEMASEPEEPHIPIRQQFPAAGEYLGGISDGWEYRSIFGAGRIENSYSMVLAFLKQEGYGDVPVPANADELKLFRRQRTKQLQFFPERGYVHNPIKILFHSDPKQRNALVLCIYNENAEQHLLRFHGVLRQSAKKDVAAGS